MPGNCEGGRTAGVGNIRVKSSKSKIKMFLLLFCNVVRLAARVSNGEKDIVSLNPNIQIVYLAK